MRRSCSVTRFGAAISPRYSTACWMSRSDSSRYGSSPRPPSQGHPRAARTIQARCHETRWTPVHLRQRERSALPRPQAARVRSHRRGGARRPGHGGIRLLCRAHNQNAAECAFGTEFMRHKRQEARATAAARAAANALRAAGKEKSQEVIPWLQRLGISARDARHAAALCETIPDAPIEERVRIALSCFGPRTPSRGRVGSSAGCGP